MTMQNRLNRLYRVLHNERGTGVLPRDNVQVPPNEIETPKIEDYR